MQQPMKRMILALPEAEYRRLTEIATTQVREPEQQASYIVREWLKQEPKTAPMGAAS